MHRYFYSEKANKINIAVEELNCHCIIDFYIRRCLEFIIWIVKKILI